MPEDDRAQVEFIFGGLVSVLGSAAAAESPLIIACVAESKVGQASIAVLLDIAERQYGTSS